MGDPSSVAYCGGWIEVTGEGKVLYKTGDNRLGRFPEAASEDLAAGPKRNFQIFDPLDFLAEVTQHVPDPGEHLIRYYGFYSNKSRGLRAKERPAPAGSEESPMAGPSAKEARKRWAALIIRRGQFRITGLSVYAPFLNTFATDPPSPILSPARSNSTSSGSPGAVAGQSCFSLVSGNRRRSGSSANVGLTPAKARRTESRFWNALSFMRKSW